MRFLERGSSEHGVDLESWGFGLRQAVLCAGARLLEKLVEGVGSGRRDTWLDEGKVNKIIAKAEKLLPENEDQREDAKKQIGYFRNNASRMRYGEFREQGLFVGSGVVEAGCKTVVGKRLKQSGMEWTVRGANAIIALRCPHLSGRMEEFWEQKAANV